MTVAQSDLEKNKVTRGRPIILQSKDGHAIWVSQATLSANQPYPEDGQVSGGVIRRDVYGNPTGTFLLRAIVESDKRLNMVFSTCRYLPRRGSGSHTDSPSIRD